LHKIPISVLVVIHTANLDVLLIERADRAGFWQSVTGSIDAPDESLLLAATRELFEETGIVADGADIVLRDWHLSNVCVPHDIPITLSPREHVAHAWLPLLAAADRCFSASNAEAILQLPKHLK
jgi:dATP pyrophosphohydrolase